jgi:hypothetical protein
MIIGDGDAMRYVMSRIDGRPTDATVLLHGDTGTGKELLARALHRLSPRHDRPFVVVNCAAMPAALIESELFGRERGAFTGAHATQIGRFELANRGTIFLDEIGELPLEVQPRLLRVLQEGQLERLGNPRTVEVDVRVVAATNRDLAEEVRAGRFRRDLYYRLNVFPITLPSLTQRREDIPALARHLIDRLGRTLRRRVDTIPDEVMASLQAHDWPGNVRELENVLQRAIILEERRADGARDVAAGLRDIVGVRDGHAGGRRTPPYRPRAQRRPVADRGHRRRRATPRTQAEHPAQSHGEAPDRAPALGDWRAQQPGHPRSHVVDDDDGLVAHQDADALEDLELTRGEEAVGARGGLPFGEDGERVRVLGVGKQPRARTAWRRSHPANGFVDRAQRFVALVRLDAKTDRREQHRDGGRLVRCNRHTALLGFLDFDVLKTHRFARAVPEFDGVRFRVQRDLRRRRHRALAPAVGPELISIGVNGHGIHRDAGVCNRFAGWNTRDTAVTWAQRPRRTVVRVAFRGAARRPALPAVEIKSRIMHRALTLCIVAAGTLAQTQSGPAPRPAFAEPAIAPDASEIAFVSGGDI